MRKSWPYAVVMLLVLFGVPRLLRHFVPDPQLAQMLFPVSLFVLLVPTALYFLPRYRRSKKLTDEGLQLLLEGRVAAALERFEASRPLAKVQVIPTYNIGIARLQLWQLPVAKQELASLEARKDLTPQFRADLKGPLLGLKKVLEVWCLEQLTGEEGSVDAIALFGEASQDSLQAAWPELADYVVEHSR